MSLLLPAREPLVDAALGKGGVDREPGHRLSDLLDPGPQLGGFTVDSGLGGSQEVGHRDAGDLDGILHGEEQAGPRALVDRHRQDVLAVEGHGAAGDGVFRVTCDGVGQRRLSRPVGAHDCVRLAVVDRQRDALEDLLGAVLGVDRHLEVRDDKRAHAGVTPFRVDWMSTKTSSPRRSMGKVATGSVAGRPVGLPVRRSKREP